MATPKARRRSVVPKNTSTMLPKACVVAMLLALLATSSSSPSSSARSSSSSPSSSARSGFASAFHSSPPLLLSSVASSSNVVAMMARKPPTLEEWRIDGFGRVVGQVSGHPNIDDGDTITTSPLKDYPNKGANSAAVVKDGALVTTQSGSKYKLGKSLEGAMKSADILGGGGGGFVGGIKFPGSSSYTPLDAKAAEAKLPVIEEWQIQWNGRIVGSVYKHPDYRDGDTVTTSAITDAASASDGAVVETYSGSQYMLGRRMAPWKLMQGLAPAPTPPSAPPAAAEAADAAAATTEAAPPRKLTLRERQREAKEKYDLTGQTVGRKGGTRYLLSGRPFRSTSGKSQIYSAYESDSDGLPARDGGLLAIKVSTNRGAIERENSNYDRIASVQRGHALRFVAKHEFLKNWAGPTFAQAPALVLEAGEQDLKSVLAGREGRGLDGKAMSDAAYAAALCVQAMHASGLVWTDLKPENFIVAYSSRSKRRTSVSGDDGGLKVKGIDLESAIPVGDNPVDYSPEACPPEFAAAYHEGNGLDFVLDYSYDVWSLGMLLYELSTGRNYFEGKGPDETTGELSQPDFKADVRAVKRNRLRNLIGKCLQRDPRKRPKIAEILLHPYFVTSSIGWY